MIKMRSVSFKIDDYLLEKLNKYAIEHRMNRSEAIRKAIELLLNQEKEEEVELAKVEKTKIKL